MSSLIDRIRGWRGGEEVRATKSLTGGIESSADGEVLIGATLGRTLATIGDSFIANGFYTDSTQVVWHGNNPISYALGLANHPLTLISQNAVGGSGITRAGVGVAFEDQMASAIASGATDILMMGGVNDCFAAVPLDEAKAKYSELISRAVKAGRNLHVVTQPLFDSSYSGYTTARQGWMMELNAWLRQRAGVTAWSGRVNVIDAAGLVVNPASATGSQKANCLKPAPDLLHPNNNGAYYIGRAIAQAWASKLPSGDRRITSNAENYGYDNQNRNILDNGLFINSSAGLGVGLTSAVSAGTITCTNSIVAREDGYGNDQQLALTPSATSGDAWMLSWTTVGSRVVAGDVVQFEVEVTLSDPGSLKMVAARLVQNGAGGYIQHVEGNEDDLAKASAFLEGFTRVFRTPPMTIAAGNTILIPSLFLKFGGTGPCTIKAGRASVRKLYANAKN